MRDFQLQREGAEAAGVRQLPVVEEREVSRVCAGFLCCFLAAVLYLHLNQQPGPANDLK